MYFKFLIYNQVLFKYLIFFKIKYWIKILLSPQNKNGSQTITSKLFEPFIFKQELEVTNVKMIEEARDMKGNRLCHHHTRIH